MTMPANVVWDIHKLSRDGAILFFLAVADYDIRICSNNADLTWKGYTWQAAQFKLEVLTLSTGKLPEMFVEIRDILGVVEKQIIDNDGFMDSKADLYIVNSQYMNEAPGYGIIYGITFDIKKPVLDKAVRIGLGVENPMTLQYPPYVMHPLRCQYETFKDAIQCQYVGPETTCGRTIWDCIAYGNEARFRAMPGGSGVISRDDG